MISLSKRFRLQLLVALALILTLAVLTTACTSGSQQQAPSGSASQNKEPEKPKSNYPEKDIEWVVPGGPGGGFDIYSRAFAQAMEKYLPNKVNFVINNMTGAGGRQAYDYIARSKPDGYTIGSVIFPGALVTQLVQETNYDLSKYTWLGVMSKDKYVITVAGNSKYKTLEDLQKAEKPVRYGSMGFGTTDFVVDVVSAKLLNIPMTMVTGYKGSAEASVATMRGDVDAMTYPVAAMYENIKSGNLRGVLMLDTERNPSLPDVPTAVEAGYPAAADIFLLYRMVGATPGIPEEVTQILRDAIAKAAQDPELLDWAEKTKHPLDFVPGDKVSQIVQNAYTEYDKFKDELKKYADK